MITLTTFSARPYRAEDFDALIAFATRATAARLPGLTYWNPGDIAWQLGMFPATDNPFGDVRLWEDPNGEVVALAIFEPPLNFEFDVHPRLGLDRGLTGEILEWIEARRRTLLGAEGEIPKAYAMLGENTLSTTALESDRERIGFLKASGYRRVQRHGVRYSRSLGREVPEPNLVAGMRLRHATDADAETRAELHRDAWSVWGPSSFSEDRYCRLRQTSIYDETLDVVIETGDGRLVSYCICWYDAANRIGHFEPVGTRPEFAGQGFARAVVMEGLRRLQAKGATTALIGTASVNAPALRTYAACGFQFVERQDFHTKHM